MKDIILFQRTRISVIVSYRCQLTVGLPGNRYMSAYLFNYSNELAKSDVICPGFKKECKQVSLTTNKLEHGKGSICQYSHSQLICDES
jgi:hypothetical protein